MRRFETPFNSSRFVLNTNTGEIHDLDHETSQCHISEISPEHIYNTDSYMDAEIQAILIETLNPNGCHYCNRSNDNG